MSDLFITTTNMISQHATLENFERCIGPLFTVVLAFSVYLLITHEPDSRHKNDQEYDEDQEGDYEDQEGDYEDQEGDYEDQEGDDEDQEGDDEDQEEDNCEEENEEQEEQENVKEEHENAIGYILAFQRLENELSLRLQSQEDRFGILQEDIVKSQEIHEQDTMNIHKDMLKRLSFLERLFRELASSEHRLNSAMLDALVNLLLASTAGTPASHHDKSVSYATLSLRERFEWMEVACRADGWAHSNRAAQQQFKALQSLINVANERERAWLAAVAYSPV